ncbi:hypothetical protein ACLOJK_029610 [Asimina triloba]
MGLIRNPNLRPVAKVGGGGASQTMLPLLIGSERGLLLLISVILSVPAHARMSLDLAACCGAKSTVEMTPSKKMVVALLLSSVPRLTPLGLVVKIAGRRCYRRDLEETLIGAWEDDFGR